MTEKPKGARRAKAKTSDGPGSGDPGGPVVIGVGASAASARSLAVLVAKLDPSPDQAIVVVLQHREVLNEGPLREAVGARWGRLSPVEDGAPIEGGRIYLGAPNQMVSVADGHFQAREAKERPGSRGTVDSFFVSLAEAKGEHAFGVVLHGTAGDGTLGLAAIKERGGLTVAELGPDEDIAHLADSNLPGALADIVVPVEEIPERIAEYGRHLVMRRERQDFDSMLAEVAGSLGRIATILREHTRNRNHAKSSAEETPLHM